MANPKPRSYFLALLVCTGLLFLLGMGRRHLWNPDEPRVAAIGAEMARTGDLVVPRLNGQPFLEKPPIYFWALSASFRLLGENHFAARFPSVLAAIGGVFLVFLLARTMGFSPLSAFLSGFVLATAIKYWELGNQCMIDMTLCFFTTAVMVTYYHAVRAEPKRTLWWVGFVLSLSASVMAKGLVGMAIPLSALFVWRLLEKDFTIRTWLFLSIGAALSFIPTAIWLGFLYGDLGRGAVWEIVWKNNFGRFTGGYEQHIGPFYFYLKVFPEAFLPWTVFLPIALVDHVREARKTTKDRPSLFLLAWLVAPFLLLSISAGKRSVYILPVYPAAALLVGTTIGKVLQGKRESTRWFTVPTAILAAAVVTLPVGLAGVSVCFKRYLLCVPVAIPGLFLGIWAFRRFVRKDLAGCYQILVVSITLLLATAGFWILPLFNTTKSYVPLFEYCRQLRSEGARFALFDPSERLRGAACFYLGETVRRIENPKNLMEFLGSDEKTVAICRKDDVPGMGDIRILRSFRIGHREILLLRHKERN